MRGEQTQTRRQTQGRAQIRRRLSVAALALSATTALTGCAALDGLSTPTLTIKPPTPDSVDGATGAVATYSTKTPTKPAKPAAPVGPVLPAGHTWVSLRADQLTFAVPSSWEQFLLVPDEQRVAAVAKSMGLPVEQFRRMLEVGTLLLLREPSATSFAANVNAVQVLQLSSLPSPDQAVRDMSTIHATHVTATTVPTSLGPALLLSYRLAIGQRVVEGRGLFVDVGSHLVDITVTSLSAQQAEAEIQVVRRSIHHSS